MEPGTNKPGDEGNANPNPQQAPTFTDEQQAFINKIFNERFGKITSKYESQIQTLSEQLKGLSEGNKPAGEGEGNKPAPKNGEGEGDDSIKKQARELLKGEQAKTAAAMKELETARAEAKRVAEENMRIRKTQAIRDAAAKQNFYELTTVIKLTEDSIVFDEDSNGFVVKDEDGNVLQNASMQNMSLEEYFSKYAAQRPYLVDGDVKPGAGSTQNKGGHVNGVGVVRTKADLKSYKDKSEYIDKFGLDAYEQLPAK